jgi:hypothetical protein
MAVFFRCNAGNQIIKRSEPVAAPEIKRLERVIHQSGHFSESAAKLFLNGYCIVGRRIIEFWQVNSQPAYA